MQRPSQPLPNDTDILRAARALHSQSPQISRNELCVKLKQDNNWDTVSNKQIKKVLAEYGLDGNAEPAPPPALPANALAAQQKYKDESTRLFRLYGRGKYDFGVSPNSDQQIKIDIMHQRLLDAGCPGPFDPASKAALGNAWPLQDMYEFYWAAAQKTGGAVTREDVGRQLEAEYGVSPLPYLKEQSLAEIEARKAKFKEAALKLKRELLRTPEGRTYIKTNARGEPLWDESIHGEFVVLVVKINKGDGLTEYVPV
ncbi:hypothetical protein EDD36DRAFT_94440 [Exophiala viscosa]|uniref:Uncharacterized protein n=1 Tax=Exophiala viscosa TaxID=2486360 RepID=A0AAN6DLT1_9EURO|nr:hypothetical protein EDD36DRAFT_94440 [Exophiala viscosa]